MLVSERKERQGRERAEVLKLEPFPPVPLLGRQPLVQRVITAAISARMMREHQPTYRGYIGRTLSPREFARSRGFANAAHMARVARERAAEVLAAEQADAAATRQQIMAECGVRPETLPQ